MATRKWVSRSISPKSFLSFIWIRKIRFAVIDFMAMVEYHYNDVIMSAMASQITSALSVYSNVCSCSDQRKLQSSASLAFVREIHQWPVNSPQKGPVTRKMFPLSDVIMYRCYITFAVRASVCEGGGRGFMSSPRLLRKLGKQRAFRVLMLGQGGVGKTGEVIYVSVHHNDVRCSVSDQRPLQRVDSLFRLTPTSNKRSALLAFCEATPSVTGVGDLYAIGSIIFMQSVIDVDDLQKPRGVVWWQ